MVLDVDQSLTVEFFDQCRIVGRQIGERGMLEYLTTRSPEPHDRPALRGISVENGVSLYQGSEKSQMVEIRKVSLVCVVIRHSASSR